MQNDLNKKICILFDLFYNKIYKSNYKLDLSMNNQDKIVQSFIKLVSIYFNIPIIGNNFLISYFAFAFSCFVHQNLKRKISLNWIIGKKMFKRFCERKDETDYYVQKFLHEYSINIDQLKSMLSEDDVNDSKIFESEELEKLRFHGEARLYNCLHNTTMYNHRSINCLTCEQKTACKKLLKEIYPRIYIKRGYEK